MTMIWWCDEDIGASTISFNNNNSSINSNRLLDCCWNCDAENIGCDFEVLNTVTIAQSYETHSVVTAIIVSQPLEYTR